QDAFFGEVADEVFAAVSGGRGDDTALVRALARGGAEGRLLVHSFDEAEQQMLSGSRLAGELPAERDGPPQVGVYVNDATGSKMSYFLRYGARVGNVSCAGGRIRFTGRLSASSRVGEDARDLPVDITGGGAHGIPAGTQLDTYDLVGPVGG